MHYGYVRMLAGALMLAFLFATPVSAWAAVTIDPLSSPYLNASLTVTGTCAEGATVTLDVPGAVVGPVSYPSPAAWGAVVSGLTDGSHTITATSDKDDPASASAEIYVDANAPVLTVSTLPGGAVTNVSLLNIAGSATDAASAPAVVTINGDAVQVQPDGAFSGAVTLVSGPNTIAVVATDQVGNSVTDSRVIRLDLSAPHLTITSPADNVVTSQGGVTVAGNVDEESVVTVTLGAGSPQGAEQDGTLFSAAVTLEHGLNTITVTATDLAGNSAVAKRSVLFDGSMPNLQVTQPPQDKSTNSRTPVIAGSASDPDSAVSVTIAAGGQNYSPSVAGGSFSQQLSLGGDGSYPVTVTCADQAGNQATVVRTLLLDTSAPAITAVTTTAAAGRYGAGALIPLTLSFSEAVTSSGLTLTLSSGGNASCGALAGVTSCTAVYTVAAGEMSAGLDVASVSGALLDGAGNQATDPPVSAQANLSASKIVIIDTDAPTASITGHPADPTVLRSATFTFTSDEAGSSFACSLDAGAFASCDSPVALDLSGSPDGRHTFAVRGVDLTGNIGAAASWSWTIDTAPPAVSVAPGQTRSASYLQTATATDGSAVAVQWSMVQGSGNITFGAPNSLQTDVVATKDGGYVLRLTATDAAGNVAFADTSLVWDTTLPAVSAGAGRTAGSAFTQVGSVSDATATTLSWSRVSGPGTVSFGSPSAASTTVSMDQDGSYLLRLTATDAAGNGASSDVTVVWDTTLPAVSAGAGRTAGSAFTQVGSVSDATATTLSWSKVSGPGTVSFGSPSAASTTVSMDQDGSYLLRLTATDAAGNGASSDVTVVWDTTLPAVSAGAGRTAGSAFTQVGSVSDATATTLSWSRVSGPGAVSFGSPSAASTTVSMDQDGSYLLRLTATDAAGNGASSDVTVVWDTTLPAVSAGAGRTAGSAFTQVGSVSDATATTLSWSRVSGPGTVSFGSPSAATTTVSMDQDGSYLLRLTATDAAGNGASSDVTVVWDSTPPSVSAGTSRTANAPFVQTGSVSDATATTLSWSKVSGPGAVAINSPSAASTTVSMDKDGSYLLRLTATDASGNSASSEVTLIWDTTLPTVSAGTPRTAGSAFTQVGSVSDATATTLSWSRVSGPGTVSFGSPSAASTAVSMDKDGSYLLRLTATDAAGNGASSDVTVVWDSTPPSVSAGTSRTANAPFVQTGSVSDATATTLSWSKVSGPGTVSFGSPSAAGTTVSMDRDGSYLLRLTATDASGNSASADVTLIWDTTLPTVSAGTTRTANSAFTQTGSVSDATGITLSWSQESGPGTVSFGSSASASTTISMDKDGSYTLRLTATDGGGNRAYGEVIIVWDTTLPAVGAGTGRTAGIAFTQTGTVSDATSTTLSWSKVSGPGTVSFGSPSAAGTTVSMDRDGSYLIRLTATDAAGNSASSDVALVWDTTSPTVSAGPAHAANSAFSQTGSVSDATATLLSWSKVSGPGTVVFSSPASASTTVSMDLDGVYLVRLTAIDEALNSASADVTLTWDTTLPKVDAGGSRVSNAPYTPAAAVSDANPSTYSWQQLSGPGTVAFSDPAALTPNISASVDGSYTLRLTATDAAGNSASSDCSMVWDTTRPAVSAGVGRTANAPFLQSGNVADATAATLAWSKVSGPGSVTFDPPSGASSTVAIDRDGAYVLRLTAVDAAGNGSTGDVAVTWDTTAPYLVQPVPVTTATAVDLTVNASDATPMVYRWQQLSGPGTVTLGAPGSATTNASADQDGVYLLQFAATDAAGNSSMIEVSFTWDTTAPQVVAGGSRVVNAPFIPAATASDATPLTYRWEQLSGPGNIAFSDGTALSPQISATADGSYSLRITATDAAGNRSSDTLALLWTTQLPLVSAGPSSAHNATFTQYGFASGTTQLTFRWSQASGPGTVSFGSPDSLATTVSADQEGTYLLRLTSIDQAGNVSTSDATLIWDLASPSLSVALPPDHSYTSMQQFTVSGRVVDPLSGVQSLQLNGTSLAVDAEGNFSKTIELTSGTNVITVVAIDLAGNASHSTSSVVLDQAVPVIALTAPASDEYKTNKSQLMITGSVDHDCILGIHVSGPSGARDFTASVLAGSLFSQLLDNLAVGVTTITLTATTQANLSSTRVITVTHETEAPTLTLTSPSGDVRPGQNSLVVSGTATDTVTSVRVTIAVNGQFYTPPVVDGAFSQTIPLTTKGLYPVTVTATNEAGGATVVTRRVIYATPTGDLNADGKTDISDALLALQVSVGMRPQLDGFLVSGDLAPLVGGASAPDWSIDIGDAVLILRIIVGSLAPPA
ncbi:PKD domain-containing protein [Geomonas azotofigens]|uniref:PKD domain-containing protein n=1 Tax=Geomonas azotofigens TaxID=2843196 RepID=UPI001C0F3EC9|nr:Ig-like domain-containing protein [Geomonas azotofigens]MBU5612458.1 Ig-like domain repeat protein [Geomonas azotofigens]